MRREVVLIGGYASIAHSSNLKTDNVDIVVSEHALPIISLAFANKYPPFCHEDNWQLVFVTPNLDIHVPVHAFQIGIGLVDHLDLAVPYLEGSLASSPDLLRMRAITLAIRQEEEDLEDFRWLIERVGPTRQQLPELDGLETWSLLFIQRQCPQIRLDLLALSAMLGDDIEVANEMMGMIGRRLAG